MLLYRFLCITFYVIQFNIIDNINFFIIIFKLYGALVLVFHMNNTPTLKIIIPSKMNFEPGKKL